jgi:hypothetical protein
MAASQRTSRARASPKAKPAPNVRLGATFCNPLLPSAGPPYTSTPPSEEMQKGFLGRRLVSYRLTHSVGTPLSAVVILTHGVTGSEAVDSRDGVCWLGRRPPLDSRRRSNMGGARGSQAVHRLPSQNSRKSVAIRRPWSWSISARPCKLPSTLAMGVGQAQDET